MLFATHPAARTCTYVSTHASQRAQSSRRIRDGLTRTTSRHNNCGGAIRNPAPAGTVACCSVHACTPDLPQRNLCITRFASDFFSGAHLHNAVPIFVAFSSCVCTYIYLELRRDRRITRLLFTRRVMVKSRAFAFYFHRSRTRAIEAVVLSFQCTPTHARVLYARLSHVGEWSRGVSRSLYRGIISLIKNWRNRKGVYYTGASARL